MKGIVRGIGAFLAGLAMCLAPAHAVDDGHSEGVVIPEPMVFDLVLALGPERGEGEVNALFEYPLDSDHDVLEWAPEVEVAITNRFALELEFPFEDDDLEAYKLAAQYTFGTARGDTFIHGAQAIAEELRSVDVLELTLLYVFGLVFDDTWSALFMVGGRTEEGDDADPDDELLVNASFFAHVREALVVGVENDLATDLDGDTHLLVMPQLHWAMSHHWELQAGVGVEFEPDDELPVAAARIIWEF